MCTQSKTNQVNQQKYLTEKKKKKEPWSLLDLPQLYPSLFSTTNFTINYQVIFSKTSC